MAETTVPLRAGREGHASHRIPAIVATAEGTLPAFRAGRADSATLRACTDGGRTWRPVYTADGLPAACSDLARIDAATVGLLYETGDFGAYERIAFRRVPVTRLT